MKKIGLLVLVILLAYPVPASALSCVELPTIEQAYQRYDGVVVGEVLEIGRKGDANEVKLKVLQSFKGVEDQTLLMEENITWGALNGPSEKGEAYLFFLQKQQDGWEHPLCSPTKKTAEAANELDFLKDKEIQLQTTPASEEGMEADQKVLPHQPPTSLNGLAIISTLCLIGVIIFAMYILRKHKKDS